MNSTNKPQTIVSPAFANQITNLLPEGFAVLQSTRWGLDCEDSDDPQWCEQYFLKVPSLDAELFIEVSDNAYYVNLDFDEDGGATVYHWEHILDYIKEQCNLGE